MSRRLIIEADGGSRGNPGPSGFGTVIKDADTGEVLQEIAEAIGVTTNNVAEYRGLIAGLTAAPAFSPEHILVRMDSKLVIEQSAGRWKVKTDHIRPLHAEVQTLLRKLGVKVTFAHIPRELNSHADRLANQAMDGAGTNAQPAGEYIPGSEAAPAFDFEDDVPPPPKAWSDPEPTAEASSSSASSSPASSSSSSAPDPDLSGDRTLPASQRLAGWNKPMDAPTTTLLLRHGESTLSIDRRFNGVSNPPLTERGIEQARAAAARLAATRKGAITRVISSPRQRASVTAEIAAEALGLEVTLDEGFRETDFGAWEGLTYSEVGAQYRDELKRWHGDFTVAPGGGESFADTAKRVAAAREAVCERYPGEQVLIVCHVTPIKVLLWQALQASPEVLFRSALDLASLTEIDWYPDGGSVLKRFNDAAHLDSGLT